MPLFCLFPVVALAKLFLFLLDSQLLGVVCWLYIDNIIKEFNLVDEKDDPASKTEWLAIQKLEILQYYEEY